MGFVCLPGCAITSIVIGRSSKINFTRVGPIEKEELITFWKRSASHCGFEKNPEFSKKLLGGGRHSISAF